MKPLEELNRLAHDDKRKRYPSVPDASLPKTKYSQKDTNSITRAILDFLTLKNHFCSRIQSQGQYNPTLRRWTRSTTKRGIGDLTAIIGGRSVMIEVKFGADRLSKWQKKTRDEVLASGGIYWEVKSFDDFHERYNSLTQNQ